MSPTGKYMIATSNVGGSVSISSNYGQTFSAVSFSGSTFPIDSAISANGQYMAICGSQGIFVSSNSGSTFVQILGAYPFSGIAMSESGLYMTAVVYSSTNNLYISSNNGINFSNYTLPSSYTPYQVAMSATGQYQLISSNFITNTVLVSTTYGQSFSAQTLPYTPARGPVAVSSTGQYMIIAPYGAVSTTNPCYSSNFGVTWTAISSSLIPLSTNTYTACSISSDGQYMLFSTSSVYNTVYLLGAYGTTLISSTIPTSSIPSTWIVGAAMSKDARYFAFDSIATTNIYISSPTSSSSTVNYIYRTNPTKITTVQGTLNPVTLLDNSVLYSNLSPLVYSQFGQYWTLSSTFGCISPTEISISANGQYVAVVTGVGSFGQIYLSTNFGVTFSLISPSPATSIDISGGFCQNWSGYAMSANGQYHTAVINGATPYNSNFNYSGNIYISSDYGTTFYSNTSSTNGLGLSTIGWTNVVISANGQYQTAVATSPNSGIYVSSNYGISWSQQIANILFSTNAISMTGQYQVAISATGILGTSIYLSSNYGLTWATLSSIYPSSTSLTTSVTLNNIAISATGQYMSIISSTNMYISSNFGKSWSQAIISATSFTSISMSANGQYQMVTSSNSGIYYTNNYGSSWYQYITSNVYNGIAISATGQFSFAITTTGSLYLSTLGYPATSIFSTLTVTGNSYFGNTSNIPQTVIAANGYIGIGTTTPTVPLYVNAKINTPTAVAGTKYYWLASTGTTSYNSGGTSYAPVTPSIHAVGSIVSNQYVVATTFTNYSDSRIKQNIFDLDSNVAINMVRKFKPKEYNYIDYIEKGSRSVYGFVAQDVELLVESAVNKLSDFLPNLYDAADVIDNNIIKLRSKSTTQFIADSVGPIKIKLFREDNSEIITYVKEIIDDNTFQVVDDVDVPMVFVFGQEVDDFRSLDKNSIFTITTAALQETDKELQNTRLVVQDQSATIMELRTKLTDLSYTMDFILENLYKQ
jgi:photosystem II stability/assembly factor-like uncharacterized protein